MRSWLNICALIITKSCVCGAFRGPNLGKSQETDLSDAESCPKHPVLAQSLRQKGKDKDFFLLLNRLRKI